MTDPDQVVQHYGAQELRGRLAAALSAAGLDGKPISARDLAPLDQFHTRGLAATQDLATAAGIARDAKVLDIGSGLGGPSRFLAETYGCTVRGIDLSPVFVDAATFLAERTGLADRVSYACANALDLPEPDESFDLVWTQHVAMNIADRARLYAEAWRVLRPGGRLAIFDVVAGLGEPLIYPVPWSRTPETSFLLSPHAMREILQSQGFRVLSWVDRTADALAWIAARTGVPGAPLSLAVAMGDDFPALAANLGRNLREARAGLIEAVLERPR